MSTSSDKMQMLLDLMEDLTKQRTSLPTNSSSSTSSTSLETFLSQVKSEQMPPAAATAPTKPATSGVTKEAFESFKNKYFFYPRVMLRLNLVLHRVCLVRIKYF